MRIDRVSAVQSGCCSKVALHQTDWSRATLLQSPAPPDAHETEIAR
jgi:hypothetical protein